MNEDLVFGNNALTGSDWIPSIVDSARPCQGTKDSHRRITNRLPTIYLISWISEGWEGSWGNGGHNDIPIARSRESLHVQYSSVSENIMIEIYSKLADDK